MQIILNQLVYFGFFQSLFLLGIYLFSFKNRKHINKFMVILIAIVSLGLLGKVIQSSGLVTYNFRYTAMSEFSALLFGPTIYLFTRSILHKTTYQTVDLLHYVPGITYSMFILLYFIIPSDTVISDRLKTGELNRVIYACHAAAIVVNVSYWWLGRKIFKDFLRKTQDEISYELHASFLKNFLTITGVCLLIWTVLFLTSFFDFPMLERNARPYIWILLTLIILFITYYIMLYPQVLRAVQVLKQKKYHQSKLTIDDMEQLKLQLDRLMLEKKPYLNGKLLKTELALMLGVNSPELARLLNENVGMNFFEYVNYYRIKEFVNLANTEKGKQLTFFGLAQESGFNSKTTFNKSFKKLMGVSPSVYFNQNE